MSGHATTKDIRVLQGLQDKISQNPDDVDLLIRLGFMMFEPFHQPQEAISYFKRAIEIDPKNDEAYFWLAKCYFHEYVDLQATKDALRKALEINPERADCLSLLASVLADLGHPPEEYIVYIRRSIRLAPEWILPRQQLALTLLEMRYFDEAEAVVKETLSFVKQIPVPEDPMKEYYEQAVTGRGGATASAELLGILDKLDKAREKKSLFKRLFTRNCSRR